MSRSPLRWMAFAAALPLFASLAGAVACSSSSSPAAAQGACSVLDACCASMSGPQATSCHQAVSGATDSACATALGTFVQAGACSGAGFDAGSLPDVGIDTALPCSLTGTCPASSDSGAAPQDAGTLPVPQCQPAGTCSDGQSFELCVAMSGGGACSAAMVFTDGTVFPCASCTNCAGATVSAEGHCTPPPPPVDAGTTCGTTPLLHPETVAGAYCPFTAAGSIHCLAGQECCETPSTVVNGSTCQPAGAACPVAGSLAWQCDGPLDCAGNAAGAVCCAAGTVPLDPVCNFHRGTGFTGSHCAASCGAGELAICDSPTDPCAAGTTCTPFKVAGVVLGTCL